MSVRRSLTPKLRVIASGEPTPLPDVEPLLRACVRRPGDRHELVELRAELVDALEPTAALLGVSLDVAVSVSIEAAWLRRRLTELDCCELIRALDERADVDHQVQRELSAAEADYLRTLVMTRRRALQPRHRIAIPVRLLGRFEPDAAVTSTEELSQALRWEAAALLARVSMSEWGLTQALATMSACF